MRIDAHHHLWDLSAVSYPWLMARGVPRFFGDPAPIQRDYLLPEFRRDARGFEASVHIQVGAADGLAEARWVQGVADAAPGWTMVQVAACDLTADDRTATLDTLRSLPTVRGVRQIVGRAAGEDAVTGTNDLLDDPRFASGLRAAGERGLGFDLQLIPALYGGMARVLDAAPDIPVALCHAGSPQERGAEYLRGWARDLRVLSERPQVVCKLSGLGMFDHDWTPDSIRPVIDICLEQFGPERCLFGSNFPVDSLYSDYATLIEAYEALIPEEAKGAVFGGTAARFYGVDG